MYGEQEDHSSELLPQAEDNHDPVGSLSVSRLNASTHETTHIRYNRRAVKKFTPMRARITAPER